MTKKCLLPISYWPNVQYVTKLIDFQELYIEQFETYPKQTFRNRCVLYGPNGPQSIQIPVVKGSFKNIIIKNIEISYDTVWQKTHLKTIESAYRSSPFFEYYIDDIVPFYNKKFQFLIEYNLEILNVCKEWLDIDSTELLTNEFSIDFDGTDFRNSLHPKINKQKPDKKFHPFEYMQGFEQRHGFIPNLSVLDLIFNTGPEAKSIILNSLVKE